MKKQVRKLSEAALKDYPIRGLVDGWFFQKHEVSPGAYAVAGIDIWGRKLSFTVQLSAPEDYVGGTLELAMYSQAYGGSQFSSYVDQTRQRGALIAFPSFHLHRVTEVARGTRYALVGWLHGPPFR